MQRCQQNAGTYLEREKYGFTRVETHISRISINAAANVPTACLPRRPEFSSARTCA